MSEPSGNPDPPKSDSRQEYDATSSDVAKKLEARTAGAPNTDKDVFKLPDFPGDEIGAANSEPGNEEKIGLTEALRMKSKDWVKAARRRSGQILTGFGSKKDEDKKDQNKDDGSKDDSSNKT
ncbi:hypothetical protein E8E12_009337 [Didymella heteroderae]|uniref:Uncharacterized protein n=1 Tax=Didymella heteroderae TaxID=1769908 RepID=A0A9P4WYY1_9PLEO|nr:hypothetical protein E8E12_009337 [Didymella heteroderae]